MGSADLRCGMDGAEESEDYVDDDSQDVLDVLILIKHVPPSEQ